MSALRPSSSSTPSSRAQDHGEPEVIQFVNCRPLRDGKLVKGDLWINTKNGTIGSSKQTPDAVRDLQGCIIAPGFIDCQINGAIGFNFSTIPDDISDYPKQLTKVNKWLVQTGVTSYLPTLTSQHSEAYHKAIPFLTPTPRPSPDRGASVLGAHLEGPFLNPCKCGVHDRSVLRTAQSYQDLDTVYNLSRAPPHSVKMVTLAPEVLLQEGPEIISTLTGDGIVVSLGHTAASYEKAREALAAGARMVTHFFNAMPPFGHRESELSIANIIIPAGNEEAPSYGIIADGVHNHKSAVMLAHSVHPEGLILVTDAMHVLGLGDGTYPWRNGTEKSSVVKSRGRVMAPKMDEEKRERMVLAGSAVTLLECVNNFLGYIDTTSVGLEGDEGENERIVSALMAVTERPARLLGLEGSIGTLEDGTDGDIVVLERVTGEGGGGMVLKLREVWKQGRMVFEGENWGGVWRL
ncbi:Putative Carbohydrate Esterase Family 9 [Podospora comata]|uniref:Carbohydrate Esterase Family 9 n=1 Tax=Podospora comata TaxID=48703 RepID=A0ABY6SA98_PODCO|nr:Putative Carbohydrate Esterase Family 9 [Podospora comata]